MDSDDQDARRSDWDRSAPGWEAWFDTIERAAAPVSERLLEMAGLEPGDRVLDIATGTGEPAVTAAGRVGPAGEVIGTDISPAMIAGARRRAAQLGLGNVGFRVLAAEDLADAGQRFDAALCRWGLMFVPDVAAALQGIRAVVHPGGRLAASAWAAPEEVPLLGVEHAALAPYLEPGYFEYGFEHRNAFRFAEPGLLESLLLAAGFRNVTCERVPVVYEFASPREYVRFRREVSSTAAALAQRQPADRVEAAWQQVAEAAAAYGGSDAGIRMENVALCATGTVA